MKKILIFLFLLFIFTGCNPDNNIDNNNNKTTKNIKTQKILVILVDFNDVQVENSSKYWSNVIFNGKLNSYMKETSMNKFKYIKIEDKYKENDGVVRIKLNINHPRPLSSSDDKMKQIISPALKKANSYLDFYKIDENNDNVINNNEFIPLFIIAGQEAAVSGYGDFPSIWAHSWFIKYIEPIIINGKTFEGKYALFGEMHGNHPATIGIIAHELGHAVFLLPDLYDTTGTNSGIGAFGIMGFGSWNSKRESNGIQLPGNSPSQFCAWSKINIGWVKPKLADNFNNNKDFILYKNTTPDYNILKINLNNHEYFLLENQGNDKMEAGKSSLIPNYKGGIAIWHVDENTINNYYNKNTIQQNVNHKGVDLVEANNNNIDNNKLGDGLNLFYKSNKDNLNSFSKPSTNSYDNSISNINIKINSNISYDMNVNISK